MPKLLPKANQVALAWLTAAKNLDPGDEMFLPVVDKKEATAYVKKIKELIEALGRDEPIIASQLHCYSTFRDTQLWVVIKMKERSPLVGFIKKKSGEVAKVVISHDPERRRKIRLMVSDGVPLEDINANLDSPLTPAEIREYIEKGRFK